MGGGYYDGDVAERSRSSSTEHFRHTAQMAEKAPEERKCHQSLNPRGVTRECCDSEQHPATTPIGVMFDVTRSRGKDVKNGYDKLPMFIGQIHMHNYTTDPEICFAAVGDATCDRAPFQVGQFESDNRLDKDLGNVWLEEGGGGTGQESYQLGAYFFARHTKLDCAKRGQKGLLFVFGDEGFYPVVSKSEVNRVFGDRLEADIPSREIFAELQKLYDVFFVFPRQTWQERKKDIDEEIKQRLDLAGGRYLNCDIRFSLLWNNRNDLDLHVKTPSGYHIYFGSKKAPCGGELDVDRNVNGETTKPVENTRWVRGDAQRGNYEVWVENYRFWESGHKATDFKVEIEINGRVETFEGRTPDGATHGDSRVDVGTFFYDPNERDKKEKPDQRYAAYDDETVKAQWATVVPSEHVLMIDNAKAGVDLMLGVIALTRGGRTLRQYVADMKEKGQTDERIAQVSASLANLADLCATKRVDIPAISGVPVSRKRRGNSKRIR